jgi:hypothetical protein
MENMSDHNQPSQLERYIIISFGLASAMRFGRIYPMANQYRHGDVMIEEVKSLPEIREKLTHTILAHGEMTGHSHRIKEYEDADLYSTHRGLHLHVRGTSVTVIHEEHAPITLASGYYRIWRQREYSPEEIRIVRD